MAVVEDAVRDRTPCVVVAEASKVSIVATRRLQLRAMLICRFCSCGAGVLAIAIR